MNVKMACPVAILSDILNFTIPTLKCDVFSLPTSPWIFLQKFIQKKENCLSMSYISFMGGGFVLDIRQRRERIEQQFLSPFAVRSADSCGRLYAEELCPMRTCFQRDVDRILYSKAFRRLKHKTQVFLHPEGDHYRTRLTHTLEVARIARTIARALCLNEDLTEAIALGHDLGHTPFGHAGERVLDEFYPAGFRHYEQSLRVVDRLEKSGAGLNLSFETRMGIRYHSGKPPETDTLEARVVRIADRIAYVNHDADDAIRAGILTESAVPHEVRCTLGTGLSGRIDTIVSDIVTQSLDRNVITTSDRVGQALLSFRSFMFEHVYQNPVAKSEECKVRDVLGGIFRHYIKHPDKLPGDYRRFLEQEPLERIVIDYVSGMTDKFAMHIYAEIFIPSSWQIK